MTPVEISAEDGKALKSTGILLMVQMLSLPLIALIFEFAPSPDDTNIKIYKIIFWASWTLFGGGWGLLSGLQLRRIGKAVLAKSKSAA